MYYLFEYRVKNFNKTYIPYKCIYKLDTNNEYNKGSNGKELIDRLNTKGIVHKYQSRDGWKTTYLNIEHENVIHGGNYKRILELIKENKRINNLEILLD